MSADTGYDWSQRLDSSWDCSPPGSNHVCATLWANGTWHTWNDDGVGGENGVENPLLHDDVIAKAKEEAVAACERSGLWPKVVECHRGRHILTHGDAFGFFVGLNPVQFPYANAKGARAAIDALENYLESRA